jgi:hypothetical protein
VLRWLLIVFTMAGLGISGVHCADDLVAVPATALNPGVDLSQFADVHPVAVEIAAPYVDQDGGDLTARGHDPGDTADDCLVATATATTPSASGATSVHLPTAVRTPPRVDPQPGRQPRLLPAATLAQMGVSRT